MKRTKQPSHRIHPYTNLETQEDWETAAQQLLDEGQAFLGSDVARRGIEHFPDSRTLLKSLSALGLMRVGAQDEAILLPRTSRAGERAQPGATPAGL